MIKAFITKCSGCEEKIGCEYFDNALNFKKENQTDQYILWWEI